MIRAAKLVGVAWAMAFVAEQVVVAVSPLVAPGWRSLLGLLGVGAWAGVTIAAASLLRGRT